MTSKTYDLSGNLKTQTDAKGKLTTLVYDSRNRRTTLTDRIAATTTWTFDPAGNELTMGSGKLPGSPVVVWRTQRGRTQTSGAISIEVVELTAKIDGESPTLPPLVRIELAVAPQERQ